MIVRELAQITIPELTGILNAELVCGGCETRITGVAHDTRTVSEGDLFFAVKGERFDGHDFILTAFGKGAAGVVISTHSNEYSGENRLFLRVEDTVQAMGDLARHIQELRGNTLTIGITGSNGKTTSKELVTAALSLKGHAVKSPGNFNNHIGVPLSVFSMDPDGDFAVFEMGTSGKGEIEYLSSVVRPDIALVTNVGDSHLEFLGSREGVAVEKSAVYTSLSETGIGVINNDDPFAPRFTACVKGKTVTFGMNEGADIRGKVLNSDRNGFTLSVNDTWEYRCSLPGGHNSMNVLGALAVCSAAGFDPGDFTEAFVSVEIPGMRMEQRVIRDITVFNDAYNANPQSMKAGFDFLRDLGMAGNAGKILVCGDMKELGSKSERLHFETGQLIVPGTADVLIAVGEQCRELVRGAQEVNPELECIYCETVEEAGDALFRTARPGDTVLVKASRSMGLEAVLEKA